MNLKIRINLIITITLALVMMLGVSMVIHNAREDIRAEVDSTTVLALHLLDAEISHYSEENGWSSGLANERGDQSNSIFRLQSLDNVRHLRIEFFDAQGHLLDSNKSSKVRKNTAYPPWFERIMSKVSSTLKPTRREVLVNQNHVGELVITPDASYEIAEIWHDTVGLIGLGLVFFMVVNGVLYWMVARALKPLDSILSALTEMERGNLNMRLPHFSLPELSSIGAKFNAMAETLKNTLHNNQRLTQQLIMLQEDERKNIARDLHDEIGQHLTAINIDTHAILKAKEMGAVHTSAVAISEVVMQMMSMVREMLQRLRPAMLDELGLKTAISELVETWRQRNRRTNVSCSIDDALCKVDETIAITVYRIVQECLTNIAKHAQASLVTVDLSIKNEFIQLLIQDNGCGFAMQQATQGFGLAGMRERVEGLGGTLLIESHASTGVLVKVSLPLLSAGET